MAGSLPCDRLVGVVGGWFVQELRVVFSVVVPMCGYMSAISETVRDMYTRA